MNTKRAFTILAASATLIACAADGTYDAPREQTAEHTGDQTEAFVVGGSSGTVTTVIPKAPRVVSRALSGSQLVVHFDRVVTASELPIGSLEVKLVRRLGMGNWRTDNVMANAALGVDGKSITINMNQTVKAGDAYHVRGSWKRCVNSVLGTPICQTFRANFGQFVVSSAPMATRPIYTNPIFRTFAAAAPVEATSEQLLDPAAPFVSKFTLPSQPLAGSGPGTFRVKSVSPGLNAAGVDRDLPFIQVEFEGGTIDCTKQSHAEDGFSVSSRTPDLLAQQTMFEDPAGPLPTDEKYRGALTCNSNFNTLTFALPGRLLGAATFILKLKATSKDGDTIGDDADPFATLFQTEAPGVSVYATRLENSYGGTDTCDDSGDWCDIYVTSAITTGALPSQSASHHLPDGNSCFDQMRYYGTDKVNGQRLLSPAVQLFKSELPIDAVLHMEFTASDADSDSEWASILNVAGDIAVNAGKALAVVKPEAGAITVAVGEGLKEGATLIGHNEDDQLGVASVDLSSDSRFGTTNPNGITVEMYNEDHVNRGPVRLDIITEEFPVSWQPRNHVN